MKRTVFAPAALAYCAQLVCLAGCARNVTAKNPPLEDPPPVEVEHAQDGDLVKVGSSGAVPNGHCLRHASAPELSVTGVVCADVARSVPVVSMASGRVVEIRARLGDTVKKGQLLMRVQSADLADAFSDYRQAVAEERLAAAQLARSKILFDKGAIAQKDLEVAQETEEKADVAVETAIERLQVLGADKDHPYSDRRYRGPGLGRDHRSAGYRRCGHAGSGIAQRRSPFRTCRACGCFATYMRTIWPVVTPRRGRRDPPRTHTRASSLRGRVSNIGAILDPNIRTAKVRVEVENPGMMRLGMFVQAKFHGQQTQVHGVVPASAILHLHDRDWVYVAEGRKHIPPRRGAQRADDAARPAGNALGHPARRPRGRRCAAA